MVHVPLVLHLSIFRAENMLRLASRRLWQVSSARIRWASSFQCEAATKLLDEYASKSDTKVLTEFDALRVVGTFGVGVLQRTLVDPNEPNEDLQSKVPKVSAVKGILRYADGSLVTHKTEHKAIELAVPAENAKKVVDTFVERFSKTDLKLEGLMFREWVEYAPSMGNEILLSAYQDPVFGPCVVVGFGGVLVDNFKDEFNMPPFVIPVAYGVDSFLPYLKESTLVRLIEGKLRGREKLIDWEVLEDVIRSLAEGIMHFSPYNPEGEYVVDEIEVNPAAIENGRLVALDSVVSVTPKSKTGLMSIPSEKPISKIAQMCQPKSMGLIGCTEKIQGKTMAQEVFGKVFKRMVRTSAAEMLLARMMKATVFSKTKKAITNKPKKAAGGKPSFMKRVTQWLQTAVVPQNFNPCNSILDRAKENPGVTVYPVHRKASEIQGIKCVPTLEEMKKKNGGEPVDVLVVAIPATDAVKALEECFQHNYCNTVQLFSAGFAETEAGQGLQEELLGNLKQLDKISRPIINGPNTVGNWVSGISLSWSLAWTPLPRSPPNPSPYCRYRPIGQSSIPCVTTGWGPFGSRLKRVGSLGRGSTLQCAHSVPSHILKHIEEQSHPASLCSDKAVVAQGKGLILPSRGAWCIYCTRLVFCLRATELQHHFRRRPPGPCSG